MNEMNRLGGWEIWFGHCFRMADNKSHTSAAYDYATGESGESLNPKGPINDSNNTGLGSFPRQCSPNGFLSIVDRENFTNRYWGKERYGGTVYYFGPLNGPMAPAEYLNER